MFLKEKLNADGSLKKLKARLVAGGHMQDRNLYEESSISSPTVSVPAVLMVSALGADQGATVHTIDFPGAYLNSDLTDKYIYMTILENNNLKNLITVNNKLANYLRDTTKKISFTFRIACFSKYQLDFK